MPEPAEWLLKKTCTRCGETKPWAKFSPLKYNDDGTVQNVVSRCQACNSELAGERKKRYGYNTRPDVRAYKARWARQRRQQLRREAKGFGAYLPVGPFREWLVDRYGGGGVPPAGALYPVARAAGVHPDTLTKVFRNRDKTTISATTVDAVLIAAGEHPRDLYPDWYEEAA